MLPIQSFTVVNSGSRNSKWNEWEQKGMLLFQHWKKKWSHFDLKSWVTGVTKIRPGIPSNWRIYELNWLEISSQFDSNILQLLGIPGRILVPQVTQLFRSKWFHFFQWRRRPAKHKSEHLFFSMG